MKKLLAVLLIVTSGLILIGCSEKQEGLYKNAYITLDVNPSIEIITNEFGDIVSVNGLNNDAKVLLVDYNYKGKTVEVVVEEILVLLNQLGYIDSEAQNEILITTEASNKEDLDIALSQTVSDFVTESNAQIDLLMADVSSDPEFIAQAEALGVSIGKLKVMNIIVGYDKLQTLELLATKPIKELNNMVISFREERVDLITQELEDEYDRLKDSLELQEEAYEINILVDIILASTDSELQKLLNNKIEVSVFRQLLQQLKTDVEVILNTDSSNPEIEAQIETLKIEIKNKKAQLFALNKNHKDFKQLKDELEDAIDDLEDTLDDLEELVGFELLEEMLDDLMDDFEDMLEDEYNLDFEDIEDAYEDELEKLEDKFEAEIDKKLKEFKDNVKLQEALLKEQLRKEKEALLNLNS